MKATMREVTGACGFLLFSGISLSPVSQRAIFIVLWLRKVVYNCSETLCDKMKRHAKCRTHGEHLDKPRVISPCCKVHSDVTFMNFPLKSRPGCVSDASHACFKASRLSLALIIAHNNGKRRPWIVSCCERRKSTNSSTQRTSRTTVRVPGGGYIPAEIVCSRRSRRSLGCLQEVSVSHTVLTREIRKASGFITYKKMWSKGISWKRCHRHRQRSACLLISH